MRGINKVMTPEECMDWMEDTPNNVERILERKETRLMNEIESQKGMKQIRAIRG